MMDINFLTLLILHSLFSHTGKFPRRYVNLYEVLMNVCKISYDFNNFQRYWATVIAVLNNLKHSIAKRWYFVLWMRVFFWMIEFLLKWSLKSFTYLLITLEWNSCRMRHVYLAVINTNGAADLESKFGYVIAFLWKLHQPEGPWTQKANIHKQVTDAIPVSVTD